MKCFCATYPNENLLQPPQQKLGQFAGGRRNWRWWEARNPWEERIVKGGSRTQPPPPPSSTRTTAFLSLLKQRFTFAVTKPQSQSMHFSSFSFTLNQVAAGVAMSRNMFLLCFTLFGEILKNKHLLLHIIFSIKRTGINFFQTAPVPEC